MGLRQQLNLLSLAPENVFVKRKHGLGVMAWIAFTSLLAVDVPHNVPSENDANHSHSSTPSSGAIVNVSNGASNVVIIVKNHYNK